MAKLIRNIVKSATMLAFVALLVAVAAMSGVSKASAASITGPTGGIAYGKLTVTAYNAVGAGLIGISNASVAVSANGQVIAKGVTNEAGSFSGSMQPGVYTLQVSAKSFQTFATQIKIVAGQTSSVQAQLMPVAADPAPGVTTEGKLSVKVQAIQTSSASPVLVQARVYVVDQWGATVTKGVTNAASIFETKLAPGSYKLLVQADGFNDTSLRVDIASGKTTEATAILVR